MNTKLMKCAALVLCGSLLLTACGETNSAQESSSNEDGMVNISWMNILHAPSPPTDTVLSKIEEVTQANIDFAWVPDSSKEERINTSLASDSLADIVSLTMLENSSVRNALKAGFLGS